MKKHTYISTEKFKATCLELINKTYLYQTQTIITKNGKPIAKLVPIEPDNFYGCMKGTAFINGNIISAIGAKWEAAK